MLFFIFIHATTALTPKAEFNKFQVFDNCGTSDHCCELAFPKWVAAVRAGLPSYKRVPIIESIAADVVDAKHVFFSCIDRRPDGTLPSDEVRELTGPWSMSCPGTTDYVFQYSTPCFHTRDHDYHEYECAKAECILQEQHPSAAALIDADNCVLEGSRQFVDVDENVHCTPPIEINQPLHVAKNYFFAVWATDINTDYEFYLPPGLGYEVLSGDNRILRNAKAYHRYMEILDVSPGLKYYGCAFGPVSAVAKIRLHVAMFSKECKVMNIDLHP